MPGNHPEARAPGYVPGLRVGCGAPMPEELRRWRSLRQAEREQRPVDEARVQAEDVKARGRRTGPGAPES